SGIAPRRINHLNVIDSRPGHPWPGNSLLKSIFQQAVTTPLSTPTFYARAGPRQQVLWMAGTVTRFLSSAGWGVILLPSPALASTPTPATTTSFASGLTL
ncbi:MAG: hypothetical protein Q8J78_03790, partial [Moraxellaceae bacterium]|nr:hypothetical protein [Moraxellaceae bacterium]